ncbi:MAG: hypothetical protein K6C35_07370 [Eubacterium sp.]|nr:hypothetical protein [Eubacterium sp.]
MNNEKLRSMNKDSFDIMLENALIPDIVPPLELEREIILRSKKNKTWFKGFTKAAIIIISITAIGSAGVYAASKLGKNKDVQVIDHGIAVGNSEYINEDALTEENKPVSEEIKEHTEGNENVKWRKKNVIETGGSYINTMYYYDSYTDALTDAGFVNWFKMDYTGHDITYSITEGKYDDLRIESVSSFFNYKNGCFYIYQEIVKSGFADDAAYVLQLKNTNNKREYVSSEKETYTLVDEIKKEDNEESVMTYVMINYDEYSGYISFKDLSEDEIHEVLDSIELK